MLVIGITFGHGTLVGQCARAGCIDGLRLSELGGRFGDDAERGNVGSRRADL